jgi:hypothetical protein
MDSCAFSAVIIAIVGVTSCLLTSLVADKARLFGDPLQAMSSLSSMVRFPPVTSAGSIAGQDGQF